MRKAVSMLAVTAFALMGLATYRPAPASAGPVNCIVYDDCTYKTVKQMDPGWNKLVKAAESFPEILSEMVGKAIWCGMLRGIQCR